MINWVKNIFRTSQRGDKFIDGDKFITHVIAAINSNQAKITETFARMDYEIICPMNGKDIRLNFFIGDPSNSHTSARSEINVYFDDCTTYRIGEYTSGSHAAFNELKATIRHIEDVAARRISETARQNFLGCL